MTTDPISDMLLAIRNGLKEHSIFPELVESAPGHSGMDITFVTSSQDNKAARELLVALGMPFAGRN